MKLTFFRKPADFRKWLDRHHESATEVWVGFYKKDSGKPSITWPESVDEALCFGWIDGIRKAVDGVSFTVRFTPRKPRSVWSLVNIRKVEALTAAGLMRPAGLAAFARRQENRSGVYSFEQRPESLTEPYQSMLKKNRPAWTYFQARPPSYRRAVIWWVISAKQEATRLRRATQLIELSAAGKTIPQFTRKPPA